MKEIDDKPNLISNFEVTLSTLVPEKLTVLQTHFGDEAQRIEKYLKEDCVGT